MEKWMASRRVGSSIQKQASSSSFTTTGTQRSNNPCPRCTFENRIEILCCEICGSELSGLSSEDIGTENQFPTSATLIQASSGSKDYRRKLKETSNEIHLDPFPTKLGSSTFSSSKAAEAAIVIDFDDQQQQQKHSNQKTSSSNVSTLPNAFILRQVAENKASLPSAAARGSANKPTAATMSQLQSQSKAFPPAKQMSSFDAYSYKDGSDDSFVVDDDDDEVDHVSINSDDDDDNNSSSVDEISDFDDENNNPDNDDPEVEIICDIPAPDPGQQQPRHHTYGAGGGIQYNNAKVNNNGSIHREIPPSFPELSAHFWSVKQLSKEGCCSINFNDFTLDHGRYNPNTINVAPTTSAKRAAGVSLDENYEKRRESRQSKGCRSGDKSSSEKKSGKKRSKSERDDNDDGDKPKKKAKKSYFRGKGSFYRKKSS